MSIWRVSSMFNFRKLIIFVTSQLLLTASLKCCQNRFTTSMTQPMLNSFDFHLQQMAYLEHSIKMHKAICIFRWATCRGSFNTCNTMLFICFDPISDDQGEQRIENCMHHMLDVARCRKGANTQIVTHKQQSHAQDKCSRSTFIKIARA